jgi:hypothetical protein
MTLTSWMGGALTVTAYASSTACASTVPRAPMLAQPDNVVVHVSPDAIRPKTDPISVTCTGANTADKLPISREDLDAALARIPPTEQRIEVDQVHGLPFVDGRLHVQGRGRGFVNGGSPWNVAISYASGQAVVANPTGRAAQLEIGLPSQLTVTCEQAAKTALESGKKLEVIGVGHFRSGFDGSSSFGLFLLDRVTSCSVHS